MVNHVKIREIIEKQGMANFRTKVFPEITAFLKVLLLNLSGYDEF